VSQPPDLKTLVFTVTNDLSYDQRMQRICSSLAANGYDVLLVGRDLPSSIPLKSQNFRQHRLNCWFRRGPAFYAEYNFRLFWYLLFTRMDLVCAIDLDTILPCYLVSAIKGKKRIYDAHELFTEMKEIVARPGVLKWWMRIERFAVRRFKHGYTVNRSLADELYKRYGVRYEVVRNFPVLTDKKAANDDQPSTNNDQPATSNAPLSTSNHQLSTIIYQGAVNEGRSFETIIPAMLEVNGKLLICGEGNFFEQTKVLVRQYEVEDKVELRGYVPPDELRTITPTARVAIMIFEATGMNQYHSLSNRFFDYIMAGVPQVCVNYPEYKAINDQYNIAVMIDDTQPATIAAAINSLMTDDILHEQLHRNCLMARRDLNWRVEEEKLIQFYNNIFTESK
jgi:glycosyltransferase involved in cell wall biosynthesis